MGSIEFSVWMDFVSSLAVLALTVVAYSALAPSLHSWRWGAVILGAFFGLIADLQMSMPLSPAPGILFDMRCSAIILAGAFLGARGLLICLGIAVATRIGIGGAGLLPGILGMSIAGAAGYAWAQTTRRKHWSLWRKIALLTALSNLQILAGFTLPVHLIAWFFTNMAPTILVLNLFSMPFLAWLMLREEEDIAVREHLNASAVVDPVSRLLTLPAFSREVTHFNLAHIEPQIGGMMALTIKEISWLQKMWGTDAALQALGALRVRIAQVLDDDRPLGQDAQKRILVPLMTCEMHDLRKMRDDLCALVSDTRVRLDCGVNTKLSTLVEEITFTEVENAEKVRMDVQKSGRAQKKRIKAAATRAKTQNTSVSPRPDYVERETFERLFSESERRIGRVTTPI